MAKNKHSFTLADGTKATRTSDNRNYTHVIAARRDLAFARADLQGKSWAGQWQSSYDYASRCASVQPGEKYPEAGYSFTVDQEMHDKGRALLEKYPTADLYIAHCRAEALEKVNKQGLGDQGKEVVLQWSMSEANARKALSAKAAGGYWTALRVAPVDAAAA